MVLLSTPLCNYEEKMPRFKLKNIDAFFSKIGVAGLGRCNIKRVMDAGFDTIEKIVTIRKKVIRKKLNYKGLIISDDISMKALSNNLVLNSKKALDSGCNLILYCGGKIEESKKILKSLDKIDNFTEKKTKQFYEFLR